jgi:hypothetical protein
MLSNTKVIDLAAYRSRKAQQPPPEDAGDAWAQKLAEQLLAAHQSRPDLPLSGREFTFLCNMARDWAGLPTDKQASWLEAIEARFARALDSEPGNPAA